MGLAAKIVGMSSMPQTPDVTQAVWLTPTLIVAIAGVLIALIEIHLNRKHNMRIVRPCLDWNLSTRHEAPCTIKMQELYIRISYKSITGEIMESLEIRPVAPAA